MNYVIYIHCIIVSSKIKELLFLGFTHRGYLRCLVERIKGIY